MSIDRRVAAHYGRGDLEAAITGALAAAGKELDRLAPEDLAAVDEFHIRGREATLELGHALGLAPDTEVLDVGSGLGGPARHLAHRFGCRVTGIDLTEEFCRVATALTGRVGLGGRVTCRHGSALAMPFADATFDAAYSQHVAMNIEDKAALYAEVRRVLKPGAVLGIYDILEGPGGEVVFPVPWARDPGASFLVTPDALRRLLEGAGFEITSWRDTTDAGRAWFLAMSERVAREGVPPLGFHLLFGPVFAEMAKNQVRNLTEERIRLAEVVCRRA